MHLTLKIRSYVYRFSLQIQRNLDGEYGSGSMPLARQQLSTSEPYRPPLTSKSSAKIQIRIAGCPSDQRLSSSEIGRWQADASIISKSGRYTLAASIKASTLLKSVSLQGVKSTKPERRYRCRPFESTLAIGAAYPMPPSSVQLNLESIEEDTVTR